MAGRRKKPSARPLLSDRHGSQRPPVFRGVRAYGRDRVRIAIAQLLSRSTSVAGVHVRNAWTGDTGKRTFDVERRDGSVVSIIYAHLAIPLRWGEIQMVHRGGPIGKLFEKPLKRRQQGSGWPGVVKHPYPAVFINSRTNFTSRLHRRRVQLIKRILHIGEVLDSPMPSERLVGDRMIECLFRGRTLFRSHFAHLGSSWSRWTDFRPLSSD